MTRRANQLFLAAACALITVVTALHASEPLKSIVASYLEIHTLLAADKFDGVKTPAAAIAKQTEGMGAAGSAIAKAAAAVGAAGDLKSARDAFGGLSQAVVAAAQAEGFATLKELGVKQAFCPMVNRPWLQKEEKIRNPYYGSAMLECGELKK